MTGHGAHGARLRGALAMAAVITVAISAGVAGAGLVRRFNLQLVRPGTSLATGAGTGARTLGAAGSPGTGSGGLGSGGLGSGGLGSGGPGAGGLPGATAAGADDPAAGRSGAGGVGDADGARAGSASVTGGKDSAPEARTSGPAITASVTSARAGIVRVTGVAAACSQQQEGSGFVAAPERVVTNAHVVQGVTSPTVQIGGTGRIYRARVVYNDPGIDLAVLLVPGLPAKPLTIATRTLPAGSLATAAGFPLGGSFALTAGRILDEDSQAGPAVGMATPRPRPVYSLSAMVQPGNSGGPLLSPDGHVVGVIFARTARGPDIGYAITSPQALVVIRAAAKSTRAVSTGACQAG